MHSPEPPRPIRLIRRVTVPGATLRVGEVGDGPPLLMLNGIGGNLEMWDPVLRRLRGRRLVMPDMPGAGESPALLRPRRMPGLASLVVDLLDELGIERTAVLGYSWGGALAQQLAWQAPDRVSALVLGATMTGLGGQPPPPWVAALMVSPARYYSKSYLRLVAPVVFGSSPSSAADSSHGNARIARPPSPVGYSQQMWAISGWSSRRWLRGLDVPTLVLSGARDPLVRPRNGQILAEGIPGARLHVVDGGHLFMLEQPEETCRVVTDFLEEVAAASADGSTA